MMKIVFALTFFLPLVACSQQGKVEGIKFSRETGWFQVLQRAKAEQKMIFLDCFTTWCAPCKRMEKDVYSRMDVGKEFNPNFISIKLQMDQTPSDSNYIRLWYGIADSIKSALTIDAYPTYIFLDQNGKPLHRGAGSMSPTAFITMAKEAMDPAKQSYTITERFSTGASSDPRKMSGVELRQMAITYQYSNPGLAQGMVLELINRFSTKDEFKNSYVFLGQFARDSQVFERLKVFVNTLDNEELLELFKKESGSLVYAFLKSSDNVVFKYLVKNTSKVDSVWNEGFDYKTRYSEMFLLTTIVSENVTPLLKQQAEPAWTSLKQKISSQYGIRYSQLAIAFGAMARFEIQQNWPAYSKALIRYMQLLGGEFNDAFALNTAAWNMFLHSSDTGQLSIALKWSERSVLHAPIANYIDTYANLWHKLGKTKTALMWEGIALKLEPGSKSIRETLEKIKKNEPTWSN